MNTLQEMHDVSAELDKTKDNFTFPRDKVYFDDQCRIVVPEGGWDAMLTGEEGETRLALTDWALDQACKKLKNPAIPPGYIADCPPDLQAHNLEHWRENPQVNGKDWFIRTFNGKCRAILSSDYTPISNTRFIKALIDVVEDVPYELSRPVIDADYLNVRLCVKTANLDRLGPDEKGGGGNYGIGFQGGNGEIGNKRAVIRPYAKRISCDNSIIFDDEKLELTHIHHTPAFVFGAIKEWVGKALKIAEGRLEQIVLAETQNIPSFTDVVRKLGDQQGWDNNVTDLVMMGTENNQSRMGLVNGFSFAGRHLESEDPEDSLALELFSGALLMNKNNFVDAVVKSVT